MTPAVAITANTTYVASYHSESGFFAFDGDFFATTGVDAPPLHALQAGVDGSTASSGTAPAGSRAAGNSHNYWVDVVFQTDSARTSRRRPFCPPSPPGGAADVCVVAPTCARPSAKRSTRATVNASTFDAARRGRRASVRRRRLRRCRRARRSSRPRAGLLPQSVVRRHGQAVAPTASRISPVTRWLRTSSGPSRPARRRRPPDDGPGGPILVVSSSSNPFSRYYAEILRAEGLNAFTVRDISLVTPAILGALSTSCCSARSR